MNEKNNIDTTELIQKDEIQTSNSESTVNPQISNRESTSNTKTSNGGSPQNSVPITNLGNVDEKRPLLIKFDKDEEEFEGKQKLQIVLKNLETNNDVDLDEIKNKIDDQNKEGNGGDKENKKSDIAMHFMTNKDNPRYIWGLFSIFAIYLPLFIVINLIGIFEIISVMNALSEVINRAITCYFDLEDKEDKEYYEFTNFYSFYYKFTIDEGIEFDLIETMSFLGIIFFKFYGFSVTSGFFMVINIIALFLIMNFFSEYSEGFEKYSLFQILYLIIVYILLFVGVGSSALLSQQLLIDHYERYIIFQKEVEKERRKDSQKPATAMQEVGEHEANNDNTSANNSNNSNNLLNIYNEQNHHNDNDNNNNENNNENVINTNTDGNNNNDNIININNENNNNNDNIIDINNENNNNENNNNENNNNENNNNNDKNNNNNNNNNNNDKNNNNNEEEEIQEPSFVLICLTSVIGFLFKYIFSILISNSKNSFDENYDFNITDTSIPNYNETLREMNIEIYKHDKNLFYFIIIIYGVSIIISIILYKIFKLVYEGDEEKEQKKEEQNNAKKKQKYEDRKCNLFGYMIYIERYDHQNLRELTKDEIKKYREEKKNKSEQRKKREEERKKIEELGGVSGGDSYNGPNICQKTLAKLKNFCLKLFECLKLLIVSLISCIDKIICNNCCGKKECCTECWNVREDNYDLDRGYFCYCYKSKRHLKWFNMFITDDTQSKIIPLLLQYFIIQLNTVAFDKIFDENKEEGYNNFNDSKSILGFVGIFGISLFLFFYITISFANFVSFFTKDEKPTNVKKRNKLGRSTEKLSNEILNGTYGVLIFNGFYSFFLSISCLYNDINNNNYFYIPILINKFYFFTFAHQCTISTDSDDEINYFTVATLLSIYLQIWDWFIDLFKRIPTTGLLYIQIIISTAIILITLYILIALLFFIGRFFFTMLYLAFFVCFFGGCWFVPCSCYENKIFNCSKKECKIFDNEAPLHKMFCGKDNLENIKKKFISGIN